jgi:tetratricopeptide (TPR) repeat protein
VILGEFGRRTEIAALATGLPVGAEGEGEALVYRTLATDPPERQLERLARAERLLGEQPLLTLVRARALAASGDRSAAQATYQGLPGLIATHPGVVLERAALLAGLDRRSEAVGAIMDLHRTRGPTRRSLLTLAELTAGEPSGPLVDAVQEALRAGGRTDAMLAAAATGYALRRGDSTLAATLSSELRRNHPTAAGSADLAGIRAALLAGDGAGALAACDRSTLAPGTVAAWRGMALTLLDRRGEALAAFAAADPAAMPALARIAEGDLAAEAGDAARARRTLTLAAGELPGPAQRRLALLALRAGEAEAALVAAESALAAEPEALGGQTLRALALAALDRRDEALAAAARVLNAQPGDPAMSRLRADLLLQQGDGTGAAQALSGAVAANPGRRDLVQRLAEVHLLLGQGPEAARLVEQLGDAADPVLTVRVRLAVGDVAGARARLAVLPATVSTGTRTVLAAGCARTSGDEAGALTLLAGHLEDPEVAVAWASLALIRPERPAVAVAVARHRLPPRTLVDLGVIAEQVGRWDEAAALLAQGLAQTPLDPVLNNNWAWAQLNLPHHDPVAVLAAAERARAALPTAPGVLDTVCLVHERAGRHRQVVGVLSEVADVTNRDARLLLHLANAREALGEREPALAALRQALERAKGITPWPLSTSEAALRERLARLERR